MIQDFEKRAHKKLKTSKTPAAPGKMLVKQMETKPVQRDDYRSYTGRLMWYVKKVAPECVNATRELAKFMDNPGEEHWTAMTKLMGYIKTIASRAIKLRRPRELRQYAFVDGNYGTDPDTRKSITGVVATLGGSPHTIMSKQQASVTLSSTESEYVAVATCAVEVKFAQQLMEEFETRMLRPAIVYVDNTAAIFLTNNSQVSARTKHIDIRHHFIRELVAEPNPMIQIKFVRSANNLADGCTKNIPDSILKEHCPKLVGGMLIDQVQLFNADREDVKMSTKDDVRRDVMSSRIVSRGYRDVIKSHGTETLGGNSLDGDIQTETPRLVHDQSNTAELYRGDCTE